MPVASVVGWLGVVAADLPEGPHDVELPFRGVPVLGRLALSALGLGTIALLYVLDRRDCDAAAAESDD